MQKKIAKYVLFFSLVGICIFLFSMNGLENKNINYQNMQLITEEKPNIGESHIQGDDEIIVSDETDINNEKEITNKEFIVCIDPGHQVKGNSDLESIGPGLQTKKPKVSSGTQGVFTKKPEYVLTLEASLILKEKLEAKGINVIMTRDTNDVDISNMQRAELANNVDADLFIRVHADGSNDSNVKGFHILIPSNTSAYSEEIFIKSEIIANKILNIIEEDYFIRQNGITYRSDLSGFNWSRVPVVLLEMGFMTNKEDDLNLSDEEYLKEMMDKVSNGVYEYLTN